jgi:hypothetical protein
MGKTSKDTILSNEKCPKGTVKVKLRPLIFMAVLALILGCAAEFPANKTAPKTISSHSTHVGNLANTQIIEASGLASSRRYPWILWVINDGGDGPYLYAIGIDGADLGTFRVEGAQNDDWEDLASFRLQDTAYLLIADVGDNWKQRTFCSLYVVEEPNITEAGLKADVVVNLAWQIRFTYEDGPQDCESVAVDVLNQRILLLSKSDLLPAPVLYELPLHSADNQSTAVAQRLTPISYFNWPTAMDLTPDGFTAAVLTYGNAYLLFRNANEDWSSAFNKEPQRLNFPRLTQQEAICFGYYGKSVYVTSEQLPAPLIRIDLENSTQKHETDQTRMPRLPASHRPRSNVAGERIWRQ